MKIEGTKEYDKDVWIFLGILVVFSILFRNCDSRDLEYEGVHRTDVEVNVIK